MELFLLEHKKLWSRKSVRLSFLLCFIYTVIFGGILSYQWFTFGSSKDPTSAFGNYFNGYSVIRESQAYGSQWGEELTDEVLQNQVRDYQRLEAAGRREELTRTDWHIFNSYLGTLWPELEDTSNYQLMTSYVEPEKLTGFYERRQQAIEKFLEISGQVGDERAFLLSMNQKVQGPFRYEWVRGWSILLGDMLPEQGMVLALFLSIVLSTIFAGEWHDHTSSLLLTTKNGWEKVAWAKICTGLAFTLELFTILNICNVALQLFYMGTTGWDMPIQCIKLIAIAPMNMLQAELYTYAFILLGSIGFAGIVMLLSAICKNNFVTLLLSLGAVYLPTIIAEYLPYWAQKILDLLPLVGSPADVFRTNTFHIFGTYIWSPYLLIIVPVLIGAICIPFAVKGWAHRLQG